MNVEIGIEAPIFLFWEYLFLICGIFSLQCTVLFTYKLQLPQALVHVPKMAFTRPSSGQVHQWLSLCPCYVISKYDSSSRECFLIVEKPVTSFQVAFLSLLFSAPSSSLSAGHYTLHTVFSKLYSLPFVLCQASSLPVSCTSSSQFSLCPCTVLCQASSLPLPVSCILPSQFSPCFLYSAKLVLSLFLVLCQASSLPVSCTLPSQFSLFMSHVLYCINLVLSLSLVFCRASSLPVPRTCQLDSLSVPCTLSSQFSPCSSYFVSPVTVSLWFLVLCQAIVLSLFLVLVNLILSPYLVLCQASSLPVPRTLSIQLSLCFLYSVKLVLSLFLVL